MDIWKEILPTAVVLAVLLGTAAAARAEGMAPKEKSHPWLYFTARDLPRVRRAEFSAEQALTEKEFSINYYGGKKITFPLPPTQPGKIEEPPGFDFKTYGHYPYWTQYSRQVEQRLVSLSLGYAVTGDAKYADRAIEYCLSLAEWKSWTDLDYGSKTCLDTATFTMGVAMAYDICYDRMTPEQRAKIRAGLVKLGLEPQLKDADERVEHNLQLLRCSGLGIGGVAVLGEEPRAAEYIKAAKDYFQWFLDARATSENTEGLLYTSYGVDNCVRFADALYRGVGDDSLVKHPYLAEMMRWVIYFSGPARSGHVKFSDCSGGFGFDLSGRILHNSTGNGLAGWFIHEAGFDKSKGYDSVLYGWDKLKITSPGTLPPSAEFRNIGWASLRSGWGDSDSMLAFACSNSTMGHNHRDQGNFVLNCAGEWLITDPGYGSFNGGAESFFGRNTVGHNSILVDGDGQDKLGGGKLAFFYHSPILDVVTGDASGSYAPEKLSRFTRTIAFLRPDCYVIRDEVAGPKAARFESLLRTDGKGKYVFPDGAAQPSAEMPWLAIDKARADVQIDLLLPRKRQVELRTYPGAENLGTFLSVSPDEKLAQTTFLTVFRPRAKTKTGDSFSPLASPSLVKDSAGDGIGVRDGERTLLFGAPGKRVAAEGIVLDGRCALVQPDGYALCEGSSLLSDSKILVNSGKPISVSMDLRDGLVTGVIEAKAACRVKLSIKRESASLKIDGRPAKAEIDSGTGMAAFDVEAGRHTIRVE